MTGLVVAGLPTEPHRWPQVSTPEDLRSGFRRDQEIRAKRADWNRCKSDSSGKVCQRLAEIGELVGRVSF
jgi:hypothetical protein